MIIMGTLKILVCCQVTSLFKDLVECQYFSKYYDNFYVIKSKSLACRQNTSRIMNGMESNIYFYHFLLQIRKSGTVKYRRRRRRINRRNYLLCPRRVLLLTVRLLEEEKGDSRGSGG